MPLSRTTGAAIVAALMWAMPAQGQSVPLATQIGRGTLIAPTTAEAQYAASSCHTYGLVDITNCRTDLPAGYVRPIDIRTAARALGAIGYTPDQYVNDVYEFILNGVDTEFRYGLSKGALGVLLDRSGTPFDQAQLMVDLLAEGGVTARYKLGTITLTPAQFTAWTTLSNAKAACRLLANGGIAAIINGTTSATCTYTGSLTSVTMEHIWVEADVGGGTYIFDPAYKAYSLNRVLDPSTVSGYTQSTFLTNALVGSGSPTLGGASGVTAINRANIETNLNAYAGSILTTLQTTYPTATREAILGVPVRQRIDLVDTGPRQTAFPYTASATRTIALHIPDAYRTSLTVALVDGGSTVMTRKLFVDEIYGESLGFYPTKINTSISQNFVGGRTLLQTITYPNYPGGVTGPHGTISPSPLAMSIAVDHPYPVATYMDQAISVRFLPYMATTIIYGSGESSGRTASRWQMEQRQDQYLTGCGNDTVANLGYQATQDKTKLQVESDWLRQFSMSLDVLGGVSSSIIDHHHSIGISFSDVTLGILAAGGGFAECGYVGDHVIRTSITSAISVSNRTGSDADTLAAERTAAALGATLEASVGEQESGSPEAASAHTRFVWGHDFDLSDAVLLLPSTTNYASVASYIRPVNCAVNSAPDISAEVQSYLSAGFNVLVHQNTCLGPGPLYQSVHTIVQSETSIARGGAFIAYMPDFSQIAHVLVNGYTLTKGSGAPASPSQFEPTISTDLLRDDFKARSTFGVDLNTGQLSYQAPVDISVGAGEFPYSLQVQRSFKAGAVELGSFQQGWTTNFDTKASLGSSGTEALGATRPQALASSIAAIYVTFDQMRNATTVQSMVVPSFVQHWWHQQLVANAVTIVEGAASEQFVRLADGSWSPPPDRYAKLVVTGQRTIAKSASPSCTAPIGATWNNGTQAPFIWDYSSMSFDVTGSGGDVRHFAFWCVGGDGSTTQPMSGHRLTTWNFPTGVQVNLSYGSDGTLQTVQNTLGRTLTFTHVVHNSFVLAAPAPWIELQSVSDGNGRTVNYVSSSGGAAGPLVSVNLPDGNQWNYNYILSVSDPSGYPADQRPMDFVQLYQVFDPLSTTLPATQFDYDGIWSVKTRTDAVALQLGGRNPWNYLLLPAHIGEQVSPLNASYRIYYDNYDRPYRWVDELGDKTTANYDNLGRVASRTFPEGNSVNFAYDSRANAIEKDVVPKPGSGLATIVLKAFYPATCAGADATCNKPTSTQDALSAITNYTWNATGLIGMVKRPADTNGVRPQANYCYTASTTTPVFSLFTGRVDMVSGTVNRVQVLTYNAANDYAPLSTVEDPSTTLNASCATVANPSGLNLTTTYTFDAVGNLTTVDGPRTDVADVTHTIFDAARRVTTVTAPLGAVTRSCYDANGRQVSTRRARVTGVTDPNSANGTTNGQCPATFPAAQWQSELTSYSPVGETLSTTDPESHVSQFSYDGESRQVLATDPDGRQTARVYDLTGRESCVWRGGAGWTVTTVPSGAGGCVWNPATYAGTGPFRTSATAYSLNGKTSTVTDGDGNFTQYVYDGLDRLLYTFFPDPATGVPCTQLPCTTGSTYEAFTYYNTGGVLCSASGQPCTKRMRNAQTIGYIYDGLDRLYTRAPQGLATATYAYNLMGEPLNISDGTHSVQKDFDGAGRPRFETNDGRQVSYSYDGAGNRVTTTWPDGYYATYSYDALNRMTDAWEGPSASGVHLANYSYDTLSRRGGMTAPGVNAVSYAYFEPGSRIQQMTHSLAATSVGLTFGRNNSGQITSLAATDIAYLPEPSTASTTAYVPNHLNEYQTVGGASASFDLSGNLQSWTPAGGTGTQTFTYDAESRLRTAAVGGSSSASIFYDYDPLGRRITKTVGGTGVGVGGVTTGYLLDGDEEIAEYGVSAGTWTLLRRYVTGPAIDDRIAHVEGAALSSTTNKTYYHTNHQGSVLLTTDGNGSIAQQLGYDEFGNFSCAASSTGEQFRFTGRRCDPETGLYYYRARYYSPVLGRFLQTDPVGYKDDLDLYTYVGNDPLNRTDPSGDYGEGSGWTADTWKKFNAAQQKAAGDMEKQAGKLDAKADKLDAKGKSGGDTLRQTAGNLRSGAASLRSDGSDGKIANALDTKTYVSMGGTEGGAARVPDKGNVMLVNTGNADAWKAGNTMSQWAVGHESLHTAGLDDQRGSNNAFAYKFGFPPQRDAFKAIGGTDKANINPDSIMNLVYPWLSQ